jgi:hypothetical protein
MVYTNQQFGADLLAQLEEGYDPIRIAKWAYAVFLDPDRGELPRAVYDALIDLFTMEEGEEFPYSRRGAPRASTAVLGFQVSERWDKRAAHCGKRTNA